MNSCVKKILTTTTSVHCFATAVIPRGFCLIAQGCGNIATLGTSATHNLPTPTGLCHSFHVSMDCVRTPSSDATPVGLMTWAYVKPRVAVMPQPWAIDAAPLGQLSSNV